MIITIVGTLVVMLPVCGDITCYLSNKLKKIKVFFYFSLRVFVFEIKALS